MTVPAKPQSPANPAAEYDHSVCVETVRSACGKPAGMVQHIPPGDGACSLPPAASGADGELVVYFDGACPLCRREIGVYRGLEPRQPLRFVDVSRADGAELPSPRAALLARFQPGSGSWAGPSGPSSGALARREPQQWPVPLRG